MVSKCRFISFSRGAADGEASAGWSSQNDGSVRESPCNFFQKNSGLGIRGHVSLDDGSPANFKTRLGFRIDMCVFPCVSVDFPLASSARQL